MQAEIPPHQSLDRTVGSECWIRIAACALLLLRFSGPRPASAQAGGSPMEYSLTPISGADGVFETVREDGMTSRRGVKDQKGNYSLYMYFRVPDAALKVTGPVYVDLTYRDVGPGSMGLQYNAHGSGLSNAYREAS